MPHGPSISVSVSVTLTGPDGSGQTFARTLSGVEWSGQPQFARQMVEGHLACATDDVIAALLGQVGERQYHDKISARTFEQRLAQRKRQRETPADA